MIWPYIIISYASLFVFGLTENIRGPLFPEILKQFGVSDSVGSLMYALSSISGLISSWGCRHLLRRYSRLLVLQLGCVGLIIALIGLATVHHFSWFLVFSFVFGLSLGILGLIPNILVPLGSTLHFKQRMLAGLHTMYGVSSLLAPLLAAGVQSQFSNARYTFLAAILGPLILLTYSLLPVHKKIHSRNTLTPAQRSHNSAKNLKPQLYLALMLSFSVAAEIMVSTRLALYMQRTYSFTMENSSLYVSYFFVAMMLGRFLFTVVHFKKSAPFLLATSLVLSFFAFLLGFFVHPLFLAITGFTIAPFYPLAISWISGEFPEDLDTAVSYMMTTDAIMLICMHLGIGKLTDMFSIEHAFYVGPFLTLLSFAMVLSYKKVFPRHQ